MVAAEPILARMLRKFERRARLSASDHVALLSLPYRVQRYEAGRYIVREGSLPEQSALVLSGLAHRHKVTVDGARQIVAFHIPGDFVDLDGAFLRVTDHNVQALTSCEIAHVPVTAIRSLVADHPQVAIALWVDTLIDGSIYREWTVNVGRRPARSRIAHLLCEFARRLELAGLGKKTGYEFPMTQEQLADATGLTAVHVNRTLKLLQQEGLVKMERRFVGIPDWGRLRDVAGFNELYLHLDQIAA